MITKSNKNCFFQLNGRKNVKSTIASVMSILILHLNLGCAYYKVRPMEVTKENIKTFNKEAKYVVIHSGESTYNLQHMVFNEDDNTISGISKHLEPEHIYNSKRETKKVHRYKKQQTQPLNEVHFYIDGASYPTMGSEISIPLENIKSVSINNPNSGRTLANIFLSSVGVFFAVMLIVALTKSSCPFVYVKSGQEYVFAGEIYPGIITANMQRDDYLPLPTIVSENGKVQLKITNELKEIQYTDLAQLVLIEHAENLTVLLDKNGIPHTFSNPELPRKISYDGEPQTLKHIKAKDNDFWSFNSTTNTHKSTREMILEFDKPEQSENAKLYLTAKNSVWLDIVFGKFNEQFGSYYSDFQKKQQSFPREASEQWIIDQNIPISIFLETEKGWELIDRVSTVGPLEMRNMVVPLSLENIGVGPFKIKLETGFMFWDVDYVAIDYSPNENFKLKIIEPSLATDENNSEVTKLLQKMDQRYLVQPDIGNEVHITYDVPIVKDDTIQSAFLKSRGYYNYIRDYEGTPDVMVLKSFREKNAFSEFSETSYLNFIGMVNLVVNNDNQ